MLPKSRRITRQEFETDHRVGSVFHTEHFSLRVSAPRKNGFSVSVVVSKKVAKRSVDRHVVKRRVYDALAQHEKKQTLLPAAYIFFAKRDAHTVPFKVLSGEINILLTDARHAIEKRATLV